MLPQPLFNSSKDFVAIGSNAAAETVDKCVASYSIKSDGSPDPDILIDAQTGKVDYDLRPSSKGEKTVTVLVDLENKVKNTI